MALGPGSETAGSCNHQTRVITLSAPIHQLGTAGELLDTILHEIAHALVGPRVGHGLRWKIEVVRIGGRADRTHQMATPPAKWVGTCPNGHTFPRARRPSQAGSCSLCGGSGRFNSAYMLSWTSRDGEQATPQSEPKQRPTSTAAGLSLADLKVGQKVTVNTGGRGHGIDGHSALILRINRKTATVLVDGSGEWRIPPAYLRHP